MKTILLLAVALMLLAFSANAQIVNNSGSTAADSMALPFFVYDSSGSVVALAAGDSLFLHVYYPSGGLAFRDTIAHGNSLITTTTDATTASSNTWKVAIADVDGSGKDGVFTYFIFLKDKTGSAQTQAYVGEFQLYQTRDFNAFADFVDAVITSRMATYTQPTGFLAATFPSGTIANTTNITAGTITTATNVTTISSGGITTTSMATNAIHDLVVAANTIGSSEIADGAITATKIADNAIDSGAIASNALHPLALSPNTNTELIDSMEARPVDVNVKQISDDATAADNFETMLDGTGGQTLSLGKFKIRNTGTGDTAFAVYSVGTSGIATAIISDSSHAVTVRGASKGATAGVGVAITGGSSGDSDALRLSAGGTGDALALSVNSGDLIQDSAINIGTLTTAARRHIAAYVADTGQILNWDSVGAGAGGSVPDSLLATIQYIRAMAAKQGLSGRAEDSSLLIRYVSLSGDNTNGKSWATAWNSASNWVDSANAFWRNIAASANYDGMNVLYFSADSFMTAGKLCSLKAPNTWLMGAGELGIGVPATKIYRRQAASTTVATSGDSDLVRILADNCWAINLTLNAVDTAGDPDFGAGTGGNNAITFDSAWGLGRGVRGGGVAYCYFPYLNHKPVQANARGNARYVAYNLWIHHNMAIRPKKHFFDGFIKGSLIEENHVIGAKFTGDHASGAAAFQFIGTNSDSLVAMYNTARRNYVHAMDVGFAMINTDSNMVVENFLNRLSSDPWSVTTTFNGNMFAANEINADNPVMEYGLLGNGGFEIWNRNKYNPYDWGSTNSTAGSGVRSEIFYDTPRTGGRNYLLKGSTSGSATAGYLNSKQLTLPNGRYLYTGWMRNDLNVAPAFDTLAVHLYKFKAAGDSLVDTSRFVHPVAADTTNYFKFGKSFSINSEGSYYLQFRAPGNTATPSNGFFLDDIQVFPHAGDTIFSQRDEQGGIAGATILWTVFFVDSSGTDQAVAGQPVSIQDVSGATRLSANTVAAGSTVFTVTSGNWTVIWSNLAGYVSSNKTVNVTANRTDTVFGYNQFITPASTPNTCNVSGTIRKIDGTALQFADVTISLPTEARNTCDSTILMARTIKTNTDANGQFLVTLLWSACVNNSKYNITIEHPDYPALKDKFTVPSSSTLTLTWGP